MIKLDLCKEIFSIKYIERAINDFSGLCNIYIKESDNMFLCTFDYCICDEALTIKEFENHIIELMNSKECI